MQRPAQQLSIIQFGAMPSPKKKTEPIREDQPTHKEEDSTTNREIELQPASNPQGKNMSCVFNLQTISLAYDVAILIHT